MFTVVLMYALPSAIFIQLYSMLSIALFRFVIFINLKSYYIIINRIILRIIHSHKQTSSLQSGFIQHLSSLNLHRNLGILLTFSQFLEDFQTLILSVSTSPHEILIGDFNRHVDDLTDSNVIQFLSLLDHANQLNMSHLPLIGFLILTFDLVITSAITLCFISHCHVYAYFTYRSFSNHMFAEKY